MPRLPRRPLTPLWSRLQPNLRYILGTWEELQPMHLPELEAAEESDQPSDDGSDASVAPPTPAHVQYPPPVQPSYLACPPLHITPFHSPDIIAITADACSPQMTPRAARGFSLQRSASSELSSHHQYGRASEVFEQQVEKGL